MAAEIIEKINVTGNEKTSRDSILRISELNEGDEFTNKMLENSKKAVASSGVFEDVKISTSRGSDPMRRVITITVKEKTTWFTVPSFSYSQTGFSAGGVVGETNLFGRLKKMAVFGDWGPDVKRIAIGYRDPDVFGTKMTLALDGISRVDDMAEYKDRIETRKVRVTESGFTFLPGVRWTEHVTTSLGIYYRKIRQRLRFSDPNRDDRDPVEDRGNDIAVVAEFDFKKMNTYSGIEDGTDVKFSTQFSDDRYFSDYDYTKQLVNFRQAFAFLHDKANFTTRASIQLGKTLPYYIELMAGGDNLRGYLNRQFRGDTKYAFGQEMLLPIYE
ncbi:MAG: outer membrane protein family, partial [Bacteriovoracaceae bacterium]|nr:outer membrane protein family [Bacteriovoracaceae bacterium]